MIQFKEVIILNFVTICLTRCVYGRKRNETIQRYNKSTGDTTAIDELIVKYEKQHQQFYKNEIKNGDEIMWPALKDKNLSIYCRKYLHYSVPTRTTEDAIGTELKGTLNYEKENTSCSSKIVIVHCKIKRQQSLLSYYITKAPEPNCVYALRCLGFRPDNNFAIIHKHCDFESKPFSERMRKRKRTGIIEKMHPKRAEPIARNDYLLEYEFEHQELVKKEGKDGDEFEWPHAMDHYSLDSYCYQYVKQCVPRRQPEGTRGSWKMGILNYQKLNTNKAIYVTVVKCKLSEWFEGNYHMTRAPETNCVYALARWKCGDPFIIIFKHCNFEDPNDRKSTSLYLSKNVIPKTEVKQEMVDTLNPLHLFPTY